LPAVDVVVGEVEGMVFAGVVSAGTSVADTLLGTAPTPGPESSMERPRRKPKVPAISAATVARTTVRFPRRTDMSSGVFSSIISVLLMKR
jgi:hypothetical protein